MLKTKLIKSMFSQLKNKKNEHKLDDFLKKLENKEEKAENLKVNDDRNLLINISKNVEQKTDANTDKPNKNEPFASAYQNAQSVNYDITSGYNSSKSFSDQQQNGQQTPQPNSHVSNNVRIVEDPPLARALYSSCEVGDYIPHEFYEAVAKILALIYKQKRKMI